MTAAATATTATAARKPYTEIEALIEKELEKERELYDLDLYDINDIRLGIYKANGWACDPWPEGEDEESTAFFPDDEVPARREPYYEYTVRGLNWRDFC